MHEMCVHFLSHVSLARIYVLHNLTVISKIFLETRLMSVKEKIQDHKFYIHYMTHANYASHVVSLFQKYF